MLNYLITGDAERAQRGQISKLAMGREMRVQGTPRQMSTEYESGSGRHGGEE